MIRDFEVGWEQLAIAAVISIVMIASYLWGYRDGVKYCVRQMQPLGDMAREMADSLRQRKP
jgi:hypothetical protein